MNDNKADLIKKIKLLASDGYLGEKKNAQDMLNKLMKKYNLTDQDIQDDPLVEASFPKPKTDMEKRLLFQLLAKLRETNEVSFSISTYAKYRSRMRFVEIPLSIKIQFDIQYDFYKKKLAKELDTFYIAFLKANNLLTKPKESNDNISAEKLKKYRLAMQMSMWMDNSSPHMQIDTLSN